MSEDTAPYGTAPTAGLSNGQEIIAKTGTTNTAQSAFFIGAIPSQALAVALFTNEQGNGPASRRSTTSAAMPEGGYGGTWSAAIWHTYAEDEFVPLGRRAVHPPIFTGSTWNLVPPGLRKVATKHKKQNHGQNHGQNGNLPGQGSGGNPNPFPTYTCDPTVVTCGVAGAVGGTGQTVNATPAGAAAGGIFTGLPATGLWVRRRTRAKRARRRLDCAFPPPTPEARDERRGKGTP